LEGLVKAGKSPSFLKRGWGRLFPLFFKEGLGEIIPYFLKRSQGRLSFLK